MLITMVGRAVRSHGTDEMPLPESGVVELVPETHGVHDGALRGRDPVTARIVDGVMEPVELVPAVWRVRVRPDHGPAWSSWLIEVTEDLPEPVDLASLAPVIEVDGEKWAKGDPGPAGPAGASVVGARDNGDQTVTFLLSDGTETDPVAIPAGPAGRGIASVSDPDEGSLVTITFTDGTETTVQAVQGAPGDDGHSPVITWDGTTIVADGVPGPDLKGAPGDQGDPGPANQLSIGTVVSGETASATITGTAPAQVLSLVLPRGEQGDPGTAVLPTTGWRDATSLWSVISGGRVLIRRDGDLVDLFFEAVTYSASSVVYAVLPGFAPSPGGDQGPIHSLADTPVPRRVTSSPGGGIAVVRPATGAAYWGHVRWYTNDPWPTILPGSEA